MRAIASDVSAEGGVVRVVEQGDAELQERKQLGDRVGEAVAVAVASTVAAVTMILSRLRDKR